MNQFAQIVADLWELHPNAKVFPVSTTKVPLTRRGVLDASADKEIVRGFARRYPRAWVGMATGRDTGIVVLDVDRKNDAGGMESVSGLQSRGLRFPDPSVLTPSGGWHIWTWWDGRVRKNSASKLAPGIDIRSEGGYVVVPPSGKYQWLSLEIEHMPEWIVTQLRKIDEEYEIRREAFNSKGVAPKVGGLVRKMLEAGQGTRNDVLYWCLCRAKESGLDPSGIFLAAVQVGLKRHEIQTCRRSVGI